MGIRSGGILGLRYHNRVSGDFFGRVFELPERLAGGFSVGREAMGKRSRLVAADSFLRKCLKIYKIFTRIETSGLLFCMVVFGNCLGT
jgi:hypothetical protein